MLKKYSRFVAAGLTISIPAASNFFSYGALNSGSGNPRRYNVLYNIQCIIKKIEIYTMCC